MKMNRITEIKSGQEVDPSGQYKCPLCVVQTTADVEDTGWIQCPMLNKETICMGCCYDFQITARSDDFEAHPAREDFDRLTQRSGKDVRLLRQVCLQHQENMTTDALERGGSPRFARDMQEHLFEIRERLKSLDEEWNR